jgi:hypothetical protein
MNKIVIAYHAYLYGNRYMEMVVDQLRKISSAIWHEDTQSLEVNLFPLCHKMYIGIVDTPTKKPSHGVEWLTNWFNTKSSKLDCDVICPKLEVVVYPKNEELRGTLRWIRDYAKENPDDYILFFHTKGITHLTEATEDWRKYMEYFVLKRWKDCVQKLDEGYDCCGVLWNTDTPIGIWPHFSGAFFWAKASYINTLDHSYLESKWRYMMEFWIGSNPNAKVYEFHNSGFNSKERLLARQGHYNIPYPPKEYEIK